MHLDQYDVGEEPISPLASVLATMPHVWRRLLEDHVPDSCGRCTACRNHGTAGVPWPCTLQVIASDARMLDEASAAASGSEADAPGQLAPTDRDPAQCGLAS